MPMMKTTGAFGARRKRCIDDSNGTQSRIDELTTTTRSTRNANNTRGMPHAAPHDVEGSAKPPATGQTNELDVNIPSFRPIAASPDT